MEFFVCPCPMTGTVILDGADQGPNKDETGRLLTKQCNPGVHSFELRCPEGKVCSPPKVVLLVRNTDPIEPLEVAFQCV